MKIYSIQPALTKNYLNQNYKVSHLQKRDVNDMRNNQIAFKSDAGALKGMFLGALAGLGAVAVVIATGGLAGVVAAGGAACALGGGAGVGAQVGGIIGGLSDSGNDSSSTKDKND